MKDPERTRNIILKAAFKEVHLKGFRAASLNDILAQTGLTKGALYHHFPNKDALGLALLDAIEMRIAERWAEPLQVCSDPLASLMEITKNTVESLTSDEVEMGCPLNNLAQEMSSVDESFRTKVSSIYNMWCESISQAIAAGQVKGSVSSGVNPHNVAIFYISAISGCRGLAKNARSAEILQSCLEGIETYLQALRA